MKSVCAERVEGPFELPGRIFRSPMPFGSYDHDGVIYPAYKQQNVSLIVVLADHDECLQKAKRSLLKLYAADGFHIIHLPISDFSVPTSKDLRVALDQTILHARTGQHVVIHCSAGIGRTGLFAACLARAIWGLPGEKAIEWVRRYIPGAVETPEQRLFVAAQQF